MALKNMSNFLKDYRIPLAFAAVKLLGHLLTNTNYGLHRDEYLYLELGRHLGWGYMEVPPMIALVAAGINALGAEVWVVRLAPTLVGVLILFLIGWQVKRLGGTPWAQALACLGYLLAPAFLRGNSLFQPVSFNQLVWFVSCLLFLELIRSGDKRIWYAIGLVAGLGILTKYSIAFLYLGLLAGMLLSPHRRWLGTPYPYLALGIALLVAAPNLWWQVEHNLPILAHMEELARTQLVNVDPVGFFTAQALMLFAGFVVVVSGWIYLFAHSALRPYRLLGIAALVTIGVIAALSGKPYYTLGVYPIMLVFGGLALDAWLRSAVRKWALASALTLVSLPLLPYSMLLLPLDQMRAYAGWMARNAGLTMPLRWENGRYYEIPQDYADMFGWDEMARKLADFYHSLPPEKKEGLVVQGGSYGHAGAINYYRDELGLPEAVSFNGSYVMWVPEDLPGFQRHILVDDRRTTNSDYFHSVELVDSVSNPFARDPGYIYYRTDPKVELEEGWRELVGAEKARFNFLSEK